MEALLNVFSAFGLSSAAGLNAYLPLLVVALVARFTNLIQLTEPWDALTSWWVIGLLVGLLAIEMTVDKIPAADSVNDIVNTVIRPVAGAILFAANSGVIGEMQPVVALVIGLLVAGGVHAVKATARPVVTVTTAGTGNWAVSVLEDVASLITSILAILVPVLVIVLIVAAIVLFGWHLSRRRARAANR